MRNAFAERITELAQQDERIVLLSGDIGNRLFDKYKARCPGRFFNCGVAEANMISTAAGLALSGKIAFACSFGCFITGRYDQVRMSVCYNRANVKLIGTHAGVAIGEDGHSQMGLEDIALMRSLPNMAVFQPADNEEACQIIRYVTEHKGPCYIRLSRQKMVDVHDSSFKYQFGKWNILNQGKTIDNITVRVDNVGTNYVEGVNLSIYNEENELFYSRFILERIEIQGSKIVLLSNLNYSLDNEWELRFVLDEGNKIKELDENNNQEKIGVKSVIEFTWK